MAIQSATIDQLQASEKDSGKKSVTRLEAVGRRWDKMRAHLPNVRHVQEVRICQSIGKGANSPSWPTSARAPVSDYSHFRLYGHPLPYDWP